MPGPTAHALRDLWQRHAGLAAARAKVLIGAAAAGEAFEHKIDFEVNLQSHS